MSDTLEQARAQAISRVCDCEATTPYGHSTERCRQAGIDAIDALISAVRAEAEAKLRAKGEYSSSAREMILEQANTRLQAEIDRVRAEAQREAFALVEQEARRRAKEASQHSTACREQHRYGDETLNDAFSVAYASLADFCAAYLKGQP